MTRTRMPLAALLLGAALLGGCDSATPPAAPAADQAVVSDQVDGLLDEVDRQLDGDEQPAEDQD